METKWEKKKNQKQFSMRGRSIMDAAMCGCRCFSGHGAVFLYLFYGLPVIFEK